MMTFLNRSADVSLMGIALVPVLLLGATACKMPVPAEVTHTLAPVSFRTENPMLWQKSFGNEWIYEIVGNDQLLYLRARSFEQPGKNAKVRILNTKTGDLLQTVLLNGTSTHLALGEGTFFIETEPGEIRALDAESTERRWQETVEPPLESGLFQVGDTLFAGTVKGKVIALDTKTGKDRWEFQSTGSYPTSFLWHQARLYVGMQSSVFESEAWIYGLDASSGRVLQRIQSPCTYPSTLVAAGDRLFLYDLLNPAQDPNPKALYALNLGDGSIKWKFETGEIMPSNFLSIDQRILLGTNSGDLYLLNAETGTIQAHKKFDGAVKHLVAGHGGWIWLTVKLPQSRGGEVWKFHPNTSNAVRLLQSDKAVSAMHCFQHLCVAGTESGKVMAWQAE